MGGVHNNSKIHQQQQQGWNDSNTQGSHKSITSYQQQQQGWNDSNTQGYHSNNKRNAEEGMSTIGTLGTKSESLAINIIIRRDGEMVFEGEKVWGEEVIEMNFIIARDQEMTTMIVI